MPSQPYPWIPGENFCDRSAHTRLAQLGLSAPLETQLPPTLPSINSPAPVVVLLSCWFPGLLGLSIPSASLCPQPLVCPCALPVHGCRKGQEQSPGKRQGAGKEGTQQWTESQENRDLPPSSLTPQHLTEKTVPFHECAIPYFGTEEESPFLLGVSVVLISKLRCCSFPRSLSL